MFCLLKDDEFFIARISFRFLKHAIFNIVIVYRVKALNSGSVLNIGNGPQSGPPSHSEANGREAAHQLTRGPRVATRPISV